MAQHKKSAEYVRNGKKAWRTIKEREAKLSKAQKAALHLKRSKASHKAWTNKSGKLYKKQHAKKH